MTTTAEPIYQPGEVVPIYADLFPTAIDPMPEGIPKGVKLRAVCTERCLTLLWAVAGGIGRVDVALTPEDTKTVSHLGGQAGPYHFARGGGCNCGGATVRGYNPWPGVQLDSQGRRDGTTGSTYGLPSNRPVKNGRFTRIRPR